ncbi:hypothetical protein [Pseudomonas sp. S32]|uniref:hypothetical protein n=1 Tax=Pseudomonas sp. S32 TaxID=2767448 RepID=UPI00191468CB|nr:hypothetical protein [Pseudomonas sp. S32]MBK5008028.1 hypothetical protein [Pseudomonas sp. S32]
MPLTKTVKRDTHAALNAPTISLLNAYDEIDLAVLGSDDLTIGIHYDGIKLDDAFSFSWWGASPDGEALDILNVYVEVSEDNFDAAKQLVEVRLLNRYLVEADQGYAFCSYTVTTPDLGTSPRRFCFVGVRPHRMEHMPVAQALQSHELWIDPPSLDNTGVTFVIPPYQSMQAGDDVKLLFRGFSGGMQMPDWIDREPVLEESAVGLPILRTVPKSEFDWLDFPDSYAEVSYQIIVAGITEPVQGPTQCFRMGAMPATLLPEPTVEGYSGGALDPVDFPDGLRVRLPLYSDLHASDWALLHTDKQVGAAALRTDLSSLHTGRLWFRLAPEHLMATERLVLTYQCAREGLGMSSKPLEIEIVESRDLLPVRVEQATPEGGTEPDSGWLAAQDVMAGAYVNVPQVRLRQGEVVEVHWAGRPNAGTHITRDPVDPAWPWRFKVPAAAIAANMERAENTSDKRFAVFYRLVKADSTYVESSRYHLRIKPLPVQSYPQISCPQAEGQGLSLRKAEREGAALQLAGWPFMASGQKLSIVLQGVKQTGAPLVKIIRATAVTESEANSRRVEASIPLATLREQKLGETFTIEVSVNFENVDNNDVTVAFSPLRLTLNA